MGGMDVVVIIDKDQVKIGGVAEFFAAKFAVGYRCELRRLPVTRLQARPGAFNHQAEHLVGKLA